MQLSTLHLVHLWPRRLYRLGWELNARSDLQALQEPKVLGHKWIRFTVFEAEDYDCTFAKSCTAQIDFAYNIATKLDGPKKVLSNQLAITPEPPEVLAKGFFKIFQQHLPSLQNLRSEWSIFCPGPTLAQYKLPAEVMRTAAGLVWKEINGTPTTIGPFPVTASAAQAQAIRIGLAPPGSCRCHPFRAKMLRRKRTLRMGLQDHQAGCDGPELQPMVPSFTMCLAWETIRHTLRKEVHGFVLCQSTLRYPTPSRLLDIYSKPKTGTPEHPQSIPIPLLAYTL